MLTDQEIKKTLKEHPEWDPLGFEEFLITEDFETVFSGLVGVYSRLSFKEKFWNSTKDHELVEKYLQRSNELYIIKKEIFSRSLKTMREYTELYRPELERMEQLELQQSFFISSD